MDTDAAAEFRAALLAQEEGLQARSQKLGMPNPYMRAMAPRSQSVGTAHSPATSISGLETANNASEDEDSAEDESATSIRIIPDAQRKKEEREFLDDLHAGKVDDAQPTSAQTTQGELRNSGQSGNAPQKQKKALRDTVNPLLFPPPRSRRLR
jgi:hypothetical protein